jgi:ParB family chromosome partitioning protein
MAKPALGRGLGALLGGNTAKAPVPVPKTTDAPKEPSEAHLERVLKVPLGRVVPCPFQPRKQFTTEALEDLANSIKTQGIIQPLVVRERGGKYELIAGERRWRAAGLLNLSEVPVIVREADDRAVLELALIENLQRENLNPMEEAEGYQQLIDRFKLTQEEAALKVGKSRAVVANALRLLKLPAAVQARVRSGELSVGHAKVLLGLPTEQQGRAAEQVIRDALNVRQTEALVAKMLARPAPVPPTPVSTDPHVRNLENRLRERLGTKVNLNYAKGKGSVNITFFSDAELERVLSLLGIEPD